MLFSVTEDQVSVSKQNISGIWAMDNRFWSWMFTPNGFNLHLAKFGLTIFRDDDPSGCFVIRPERTIETNKCIQLIFGRFPFSLRTEDVFTAGFISLPGIPNGNY